ncbi:MAG: hypothetical protein IPP72_19700 [Chitinophagaceae bacterium]|nr:hypothetical protein [Chitinophagaceae bacterium]
MRNSFLITLFVFLVFSCQKEISSEGGTITSVATITTNSTTNLTDSTATSGGNITSDGGAAVTARGVCWSISPNPVVAGNHSSDGAGTGSFTSLITGLDSNNTYYVRAYATNSAGTAYGNEISFKYSSTVALPTVTTNTITAITSASAASGGNITADGGATVTSRGICWNTTPNPVVAGSHTTDGSGTGIFTSTLTALTSGTLYYVRAYATNSAGTAYGNEVNFTTTSTSLHDVYVAGFESNGTTTIAKIWKNAVATALTDGSKDGIASSIFVSGTDVYATGIETGSTRIAEIWKNGVATTLVSGPLYIAQSRSILYPAQMCMWPGLLIL